MSELTVLINNTIHTASFTEGESLLAVLQREGFSVNAPCGGKGKCGNCTVTLKTASGSSAVRACRTPAADGCTVVLSDMQDDLSWNFTPGSSYARQNYSEGLGAAVDLGTTSIAVSLFDLSTGEKLETAGAWNEQRAYGADVITRIAYTMDHPDGLERLSSAVRRQIRQMTEELCRKHHRSWQEIQKICLAGNTTMQHLFVGFPVAGIAAAPFRPYSVFDSPQAFVLDGKAVQLSPCVSGYVGGDITAGLSALELGRAEGNHLFLDVGTNGEMALGGKNGFLTCAVACGPAFEGAGISCGMPASAGAINRFYLAEDQIGFDVIGGGLPKGICGSGLLDLAACLVSLGYISADGQLLCAGENGEEGVFFVADGVSLTARDVRQLQLAKAAVAAGIRILMEESGLRFCDIDTLWLAGGFGNRLDPKSAVTLGMLPEELLEKIHPAGNTSLAGTETALLSGDESRLLRIQSMCSYLELSSSAEFSEAFVEEMAFPSDADWEE